MKCESVKNELLFECFGLLHFVMFKDTKKLSRNRFANERKYFGLHLFYVLYAIPSIEGLKAEAAEKERVYGLCDKT